MVLTKFCDEYNAISLKGFPFCRNNQLDVIEVIDFYNFSFLKITKNSFTTMGGVPSLHNIELTLINGEEITLSRYAGRKLLIVNVASKCGFTSQYQGLQELYKANTDKLEIIAIPCNDFGGQEPGNQQEIAEFCEKMYGVTFTIADKAKIVDSPHPLFQWLTSKEHNGVLDADITWNFYKFLVNGNGQLEHMYSSDVHPFDDEIYSWVVNKEPRMIAS